MIPILRNIKKEMVVLVIIASLAVGVRMYRLELPVVEPFNSLSRQIICATVARNFYMHGFNLFNPEIDEGAGPYLYNAELPLNTYLMALGYWLSGGIHVWVARLVTVFFSTGLLIMMYLLIAKAAGPRAGIAGLFFGGFSPLMLALSRSLQPEIPMLFFGTCAVYFLWQYLERSQNAYFWASAVMMFLGVLQKITVLYLAPLLLIMLIAKKRKSMFTEKKNYIYAFLVLTALVWYARMYFLAQGSDLTYKPYEYVPKDGGVALRYLDFWNKDNLWLNLKFVVLHFMTPVGFLLFLLGFLKKYEKWPSLIFYGWFAAAIMYILSVWPIAVKQSYYLLAFFPPVAYFIGQGWIKIERRRALAATAIIIFLATASYYYKGIYFIQPHVQEMVDLGEAADRLLPKDAKVVTSYGSSPALLYYTNRKGWTLNLSSGDSEYLVRSLRALNRMGADYYVIVKTPQTDNSLPFFDHLKSFELLVKTDEGALYKL